MVNKQGDRLEGHTRDKGESKRDHGQAYSQTTSGEMTELIDKPKQRGGKRPGAGRKEGSKNKATIEKEVLREELRALVAAKLAVMTEAQIANAQGIKYLVARDRKTGKFRRLSEDALGVLEEDDEREVVEVWEKDPNVSAYTDLLNRTIDKPTETLQATVTVAGIEQRLKAAAARKRGQPS
jgi:hypothetical protein